MAIAIAARNLSRSFKTKQGTIHALRGVDLDIHDGELFGLLGPNGAGKTTLIKIASTLMHPTSGTLSVGGYDVMQHPKQIRRFINTVSGGETSGYGLLTVRENLWMFAQFHGIPSKLALAEIDRLCDEFGLATQRDRYVRTLSTGQRQKMNMIRALVTDPTVLFLDEPTLGLDVQAARLIRSTIRRWLTPERTIILTTHYMAEADELCDRIAIIDDGRILALDTPENLKRLVQLNRTMTIEVQGGPAIAAADLEVFKGVEHALVKADARAGTQLLDLQVIDEGPLAEIIDLIVKGGGSVTSFQNREPTLEDVFVHLVGHGLDEGTKARVTKAALSPSVTQGSPTREGPSSGGQG